MPLGIVFDGEVVQATSYLQLEPVPRSAGLARRFVREHTPELPEPVQDCLQLLTTELVTNAILHARTALELGTVVAQASVVISVHDLDLAVPLQNPYAEREGGWGLALVEAMAQSWSTYRHPEGGKTIWFRVLRAEGLIAAEGSATRDGAATQRHSDSLRTTQQPHERNDR